MNHELALSILKQLSSQGVKTLAVCAGARNAPFIHILEKSEGFEVLSFFDERSAAFFALGRARRDERPVAVLTTSGTAVSELLSAGIEAFYSNVPLVLLTSDRPKRLRGSGAPQTIKQKDIFQNYAEFIYDLDVPMDIRLSLRRPTHINVCFDEPLKTKHSQELYKFEIENVEKETQRSLFENEREDFEKSLVVVGSLTPSEREALKPWLEVLSVPVFYEVNSGLKSMNQPKDNQILGGEKMLSQMLRSGDIENVIRIGDVPLGRYWRDLDRLEIPTLSISSKPFKGTEKSRLIHQNLEEVDIAKFNLKPWDFHSWQKESAVKQKKIDHLMDTYPLSEAAWFRKLLFWIPEGQAIYVGNSLPVRLIDLVGESSWEFSGNRGANGIDGQLSSAFGWFKPDTMNTLIAGDLTTLYDSNGLWMSETLKRQNTSVNLLVINNGGGKIFSRIFEEKLFQNRHQLNFSAMADMWGWKYHALNHESEIWPEAGLNLLECCPDQEQDQEFWEEYDQLWQ